MRPLVLKDPLAEAEGQKAGRTAQSRWGAEGQNEVPGHGNRGKQGCPRGRKCIRGDAMGLSRESNRTPKLLPQTGVSQGTAPLSTDGRGSGAVLVSVNHCNKVPQTEGSTRQAFACHSSGGWKCRACPR